MTYQRPPLAEQLKYTREALQADACEPGQILYLVAVVITPSNTATLITAPPDKLNRVDLLSTINALQREATSLTDMVNQNIVQGRKARGERG